MAKIILKKKSKMKGIILTNNEVSYIANQDSVVLVEEQIYLSMKHNRELRNRPTWIYTTDYL